MNSNLPTIELTAAITIEVNGEQHELETTYTFTPLSDHDTADELRQALSEQLLEEWTEEHATPIDIDADSIDMEVTDWDTTPDAYANLFASETDYNIFAWAQHVEDAGSYGDNPDVILAAFECGINADDIEEAYQGSYKDDEDFAQEMADQLGAIDKNAQWPMTCIDWERAARELMYDYSEHNGHYFRNI